MSPFTRRFSTLLTLSLLGAFAAASAQQERKQFDVISIRENRAPGHSSSSFPLDPTARYNYHGNLLRARSIPLLQLLVFAYAKNMYQIIDFRRQLPAWARDMLFDVEARTEGSPTKDEMRAMVRSLLEDRFQLKLHTESQKTDVLRLEVVHPGKLGPNIRPYASTEPPCDAVPPYGDVSVALTPAGFPAYCGVLLWIPGTPNGEMRIGGRRLTSADIALGVGAAADFIQRPVVDATGLTGTYDLLLDYAPVTSDPARSTETSNALPLEIALRKQLGLKLQPGKGSVETYVIDHVSKPSEN
ncbi:MAG TPA: TIGR03435 family protein [Acidobacteriaceae bacterium]|nr:TIGR03435 family protein [Acidobacteriaceae bacterium]